MDSVGEVRDIRIGEMRLRGKSSLIMRKSSHNFRAKRLKPEINNLIQ